MSSGKRAGLIVGLALTVLMSFGGGLPPARADTLYVNVATGNDAWDGRCETWDGATCGPKATIQAGINAAVAGDEIVIADGTYTGTGNKNLDFLGKAITVRSASDNPALCVIDCEDSGRGLYFHSGEGEDSVVAGLTVLHGSATYEGGGVYCSSSSPTLTHCRFSGNSVTGQFGAGGGVYCRQSNVNLTNCTLSGNSAERGAGLYCYGGSPTLVQCTLSGNAVTDQFSDGGGVYSEGSSPTLTSCVISGNLARDGAGVFFYGGSATLTNCVIRENSGRDGAGVCCLLSSPTLTSCTLTGNGANGRAGGVYCYLSSSPILTNCILWDDTPEEIYVYSGNPSVTYCDVQGGWPGTGNIDVDPGFVVPGDVHLSPDSPCVDAGTNTPSGGLPAMDADGNPRPLDGNGDAVAVADIGVYEFNPAQPCIAAGASEIRFAMRVGGADPAGQTLVLGNAGGGVLHWTIAGTPAWLTVTPNVGDLASAALANLTVSVNGTGLAHGVYSARVQIVDVQASNSPWILAVTVYVGGVTQHVPGDYATIQAAIDAAVPGDAVELADGVYAGVGNKRLDVRGKAITVRSASGDPASCVIDCGNAGCGFYFHSGEGVDSVLADLTIANGSRRSGAGVYCAFSSPTLSHCILRNNTVTGGEVGYAGGLYCYRSSPMVSNCTFQQNWAVFGGAVYCYSSSPTLIDCDLVANTAFSEGGAVECKLGSRPTLNNCTLNGNVGKYGGALFGGSPVLTNCTLSRNSGQYGGIYGGSPTLTNCVLWGNTPQEIYAGSTSPAISYCDVQGGWSGEGNIDADPLFVDADGADDDPNTWADNNYRLSPGSPCIDAGSNAAVPPDLLFDLDGLPRITDGNADGIAIVDIGAYERPATIIGDLNCDGVVDFGDINPFVDVLMGLERYAAKYPGCDYMFADVNADGLVNFGDINPFIDLLMGR